MTTQSSILENPMDRGAWRPCLQWGVVVSVPTADAVVDPFPHAHPQWRPLDHLHRA